MPNLTLETILIIQTLFIIVQTGVIIWEIWAIRKLTKQLNELNDRFRKFAEETMQEIEKIMNKLKPLFNAVGKATPFLDVFNSVLGMFKGRRPK